MCPMRSGDETSSILTFNGLVSKLDHLLLQFHLVVVAVTVGSSAATNTLWRLGDKHIKIIVNDTQPCNLHTGGRTATQQNL